MGAVLGTSRLSRRVDLAFELHTPRGLAVNAMTGGDHRVALMNQPCKREPPPWIR
jgi:hypothetical protein